MDCFVGSFDHRAELACDLTDTSGYTQSEPFLLTSDCQLAELDRHKLFFWGRIFNATELAESQDAVDANSAELLLSVYLNAGLDGLKRIDGRFTLIILDDETLIAVRDRHGRGPMLFYTSSHFASSIHGLMKVRAFKTEPDCDAIASFLYGCFVVSPATALKNVSKLAGGDVLVRRQGQITVKPLDDPDKPDRQEVLAITEEEATDRYAMLLRDAVRRRIAGCSTVGILLSGGYDSGGNLATLRDVFDGRIEAYSIGFKDSPLSELPHARLAADAFGAEHHTHELDASALECIPRVVHYLGEPFAEQGFFINYAVLRQVDPQLPVVLGGEGTDQLFGVAPRELARYYLARKCGLALAQRALSLVARHRLFHQDNPLFRIRSHNEKILNVLSRENFGFTERQLTRMMRIHWRNDFAVSPTYRSFDELYDLHNRFIAIRVIMNEGIVYKASRMAAMSRVNLTFPYLDTNVHDFVRSLPRQLKAPGSVLDLARNKTVMKYLHRKAFESRLPVQSTDRSKQGGFTPLEVLLGEPDTRRKITRYIARSSSAAAMFRPESLKSFLQLFEERWRGRGYWFWYRQILGGQLLNLLILSVWWDIFIEGDVRPDLSDYLD